MNNKTFLIMAGGTGGHVYPALAIAKKLQEQQDQVFWLGSIGGMEQRVVTASGIAFFGISIKGVRGKGWLSKLRAPIQIARALFQAIRILRQVKPDCVIGMGGFASGPGGLAAKLLGKPLVIHEQNAVAGMTNRLLAHFANSVVEAFPGSFPRSVRTKQLGNPLREEIGQLYYQARNDQPRNDIPADRPVQLLVLGGSLGAARLNECVPAAVAQLEPTIRPRIWHQTGNGHDQATQAYYQHYDVQAKVSAYLDNMAEAYQWADLVISRAGALTISELCAVGLGAILVPYPHAVDDHQTRNARTMEQAGAAWLLPQPNLEPTTLAEILKTLLEKRERIAILAQAARKLGQPDATERVAAECRRVCYA